MEEMAADFAKMAETAHGRRAIARWLHVREQDSEEEGSFEDAHHLLEDQGDAHHLQKDSGKNVQSVEMDTPGRATSAEGASADSSPHGRRLWLGSVLKAINPITLTWDRKCEPKCFTSPLTFGAEFEIKLTDKKAILMASAWIKLQTFILSFDLKFPSGGGKYTIEVNYGGATSLCDLIPGFRSQPIERPGGGQKCISFTFLSKKYGPYCVSIPNLFPISLSSLLPCDSMLI